MINLYLILSLVTYIFILLRWIFRRRFSVVGLSDNGNANNGKKGKARLFVPCPLSSISCRGGCYRSDLKSSKQVVYLRGYLLKVQIYQPFSRAGCVLPWQIKRILVIASRSIKVCSSISQAAAQVEKVFPVLYLCEERPALTNSRRGDILLPFIGGNAPA